MSPRTRLPDAPVLVVAPTGRDGEMLAKILGEAGIEAQLCTGVADVCARLDPSVGALLLAEEALTADRLAQLSRTLEAQPVWSDLPVILSTGAGETTAAQRRSVAQLAPHATVTLLERPVKMFSLLSAIQAALRARRRQYQVRDLLAQQQIQVEELRNERELRARFVSVLAHDLRSPLSVAKLAAHRLITKPGELDVRRDLAIKIDRNIDRTDRMIRDLLDANRIEAGQRIPLRLDTCDLCAVTTEVCEELNAIYPDRLHTTCDQPVRGIWSADELRRAIWNLAANAIKYGAPGRPVTIQVRAGKDTATVEVHNEGTPIAAADQARIFEPFARTKSAQSEGQLGWGLGLTLVRGAAEGHGGTVRVVSAEGKGTTFILELPYDARPAQPRD